MDLSLGNTNYTMPSNSSQLQQAGVGGYVPQVSFGAAPKVTTPTASGGSTSTDNVLQLINAAKEFIVTPKERLDYDAQMARSAADMAAAQNQGAWLLPVLGIAVIGALIFALK